MKRLKETPAEKLVKSAQAAEGLEGQSNGATVNPVYRPREMQCIAVTVSELKQIGLSNFLSAAFFGIGSALFAFALDVDKDLYLSDETPTKVAELAELLSTLCWIFGVVFYLLTLIMWWWRRDILQHIEEETKSSRK